MDVVTTLLLLAGTIDTAHVYSRAVVKAALHHNSAAIALAHNHLSGILDPSEADQRITQRIIKACDLMDIRFLDHFIIAGKKSLPFLEEGLI